MRLPDIDPVETALAVIGVRPLISKEVERVTSAQFHAMDRLPERITDLAKQLVAGTIDELHFGDISYKSTLNDLSEKPDFAQIEKMVAAFPADHSDLASAFLLKAKDVLVYLRARFPMATTTNLAGPRNIPPPELDQRRFVILLDAVDDPTRVFGWMESGALLKRQVQGVRDIYPTLAAAIDYAINDPGEGAIVSARAAKQSFELAVHTERGINTWLGKPPIDPALARALQAGYRKADADRAAARQPQSQGTVVAKEAMSQAQKSVYPDAMRSDSR